MFFSLSKLVWFLIAPSHLLLWLVLGAALAHLLRYPRIARTITFMAGLLFLCAAVLPLWVGLARPLEDRHPRGGWPAHVEGILVLGGGLDTALLRARGAPRAEASTTRLLAAAEAARRYPQARLIFSGGSATGDPGNPESAAAAYLFRQAGIEPGRLLLESRARDTFENILFSRQLAQPRSGEHWLLVTSALHMPRAMAAAEAQGWSMQPWPSDYLTPPAAIDYRFQPVAYLDATDAVAHEWLGLLAYRFRAQPARR